MNNQDKRRKVVLKNGFYHEVSAVDPWFGIGASCNYAVRSTFYDENDVALDIKECLPLPSWQEARLRLVMIWTWSIHGYDDPAVDRIILGLE